MPSRLLLTVAAVLVLAAPLARAQSRPAAGELQTPPAEVAAAAVAAPPTELERPPGTWLRGVLPEPLLRTGPRELAYWQWLALPLLVILAWAVARVLGWLTRRALGHVASRTRTQWDDVLLHRIGAPLTGAWMVFALYLLVALLGLDPDAEVFVDKVLRAAFLFVLFWALWRSTDVAGDLVAASPTAKARPALGGLIPLTTRIAKVAVVLIAMIAVLSELGFPVASLLAGLGIGGLALALAAQKTIENLFGSVAIGVDQPFRVGDFVKVDEVFGTVEKVGLRSTRIRTLDRTLVSLPNGQLADKRIENFGVRDRYRLDCTVGVVYGTTPATMRRLLGDLQAALRAHPKVWQKDVITRLKGLGPSSLDIEVMVWFHAADYPEFLAIREEVLLQILDVVERCGCSFAFPTQTVHVATRQAS